MPLSVTRPNQLPGLPALLRYSRPNWGELKKGNFTHAKRQFSSEAKHVLQDTIGYRRQKLSSRFLEGEAVVNVREFPFLEFCPTYGSEFDSLAKVAEQVKHFLNGELPDVVIDNTDDIEVICEAYRPRLIRDERSSWAYLRHDRETRITTLPLHFGKVTTGSHGGESRLEKDIPRNPRLRKAGKLRLESLTTNRSRSRKSIINAIARMRSGVTVGCFFLRMDH